MLVYLEEETKIHYFQNTIRLSSRFEWRRGGGVNGKKEKKNKTNTFFKADNYQFRNKLRIATAEERRADR